MSRAFRQVFQWFASARGSALLATTVVLAGYLAGVPLLDLLELKTYDMRLLATTGQRSPANVAIAAIDERSITEIGRWPWSRKTLATLIERLGQAGARVIAFDVFFAEPENRQILEEIDRLEGRARADANSPYGRLRETLAADAQLAQAIRRNGTVVLPIVFLWSDEETRHVAARDAGRALASIAPHAVGVVRTAGGDEPQLRTPDPKGVVVNLAALQAAARTIGHINMIPDADGTLRRAALVIRFQGRYYPAADVQAARLQMGMPNLTLHTAAYGITGVAIGERLIATDEEGRALVRYYGPEHTVPTIPAVDILAGRADTNLLRDRIVLIGATAKGIGDVRVTPYGPVFPGVEIRASVVQNLLDGSFLQRTEWMRIVEVLLLVAMGVSLSYLLPRLGVRAAAALTAILLATVIAAGTLLFRWQLWLGIVYPSMLLVALFVATTIVKYFTTESEKRQIKSAFQHYVPAKLVDEITHDLSKLQLGGDKRELTVLFSDIRGFTSLAETLAPEDLVRLLNTYLTQMTDKVFLHDGLLDKYIGDAIMAVYGAPIHRADHAMLACRTALDMMRALRELRSEWKTNGQPVLDIGIGINSGPMVVGNMGSETRFDYTVIGDAVNLGSRIESLNKVYGTHILLSEFTYRQVQDGLPNMREVDVTRIRGREAPVRLYELIPEGRYANLDWLGEYAHAYTLYHRGERKQAAAIFQALSHSIGDPVSQYYVRRDARPRRRANDET